METNAQYFDCLCRTCMNKVETSSHDGTTKPHQQWLSIFDTIEECGAFRIAELLSDAVPQIVVQPIDELPKKICPECQQQLLNVYWFQQMCVQSEKEMHELLSKEQTALKTPVLEETIKGETDDSDSQPLKDLACGSTVQNLQQLSIQESLAEVTIQTIEPEAERSNVAGHLQVNIQQLEHCNDSQGDFGEIIKNEPIEYDEANSEYSDGDAMHSTISVTKYELIDPEDQQVNDASSRHNCHLCNKSFKMSKYLMRHLKEHKKKAKNSEEYCFACHLCGESYKKQQYLTSHLKLAHSIEPQHTCDFCNKSFATPARLRNHLRIHTGERPYACSECGKSFTQQSHLANHRNIHSEDKPYECPCCPLRFTSKALMANHKRNRHGEAAKRYECDICGKKLSRKSILLRHKLLIHSGEKSHKCDLCEKRFGMVCTLKRHIRTHTGEKPYKCKYCERAFAESGTLNTHLRSHPQQQQKSEKEIEQPSTGSLAAHRNIHSGDKPYECPCCPLRFASKTQMANHKKNRHEETVERYECDICGKKLKSKSILVEHKRIHSGEKPHKCDFCEKRFIRHYKLLIHNRTHTGDKRYKCKYCERAYTTNDGLLRHSRRHVGANVYRCKFCPLAFPLDSELRLHLTSHKNEDPETRERNLKALQEDEAKLEVKFSKERAERQSTEEPSTDSIQAEQRTTQVENKSYECPLRFGSRSNVSTHKTIHEGIKPHKCSICGKRFRTKSNLIVHKRIHNNEKPHKCDQCEKRFTHMNSLKIHIRKHTGEKPYKCQYCERRFISSSLLSQHLRSHLGKNIYRCELCPLAFPSSAEMHLHLTSHKSEDQETRDRNLKALQEEEVQLKLKFSKEKSKGQPKEELQQEKLCKKETEQQSTDSEEFEEFIKNEPIENDILNMEYRDTVNSIISVTKDEVLPIESEDEQVNETCSHVFENAPTS